MPQPWRMPCSKTVTPKLQCRYTNDYSLTATRHPYTSKHVYLDHIKETSTSVFGDGRMSTHADPIRPHVAQFHERRISSALTEL